MLCAVVRLSFVDAVHELLAERARIVVVDVHLRAERPDRRPDAAAEVAVPAVAEIDRHHRLATLRVDIARLHDLVAVVPHVRIEIVRCGT